MEVIATVLYLCLGISYAYKLSCPDASQWSTRAIVLCPNPLEYNCLWDDNVHAFIEHCSKAYFSRAGETEVIHNKFCHQGVVQNNGCIKKSLCNEEGQVVYDDTDTKQDTKCTCDYIQGYDFITRPNNPCYCIPSEEDCSCYFNPCIMAESVSDPRCSGQIQLEYKNCLPLKNIGDGGGEPLIFNTHRNPTTSDVSVLGDHLNVTAAKLLLCCIIAILGLSVIVVRFRVRIDNVLKKYFRAGERTKARYLDKIKTQSERRLFIRVMIVGKHGVGKSCLLRRLLNEGIGGVESTDGVDIAVRRCKIRLSDGKWIFDTADDPKREYATRIRRALRHNKTENENDDKKQTFVKTVTVVNQEIDKEQTFVKPVVNQEIEEVPSAEQEEEVPVPVKTEDAPPGHQRKSIQKHSMLDWEKQSQPPERPTPTRKATKVLTDEVENELEHFLSHIDKYEREKEIYIEIGFWDFAGEKEYYGTHHTFLDSHALYLLVTDCSEDVKKTEPSITYDSIGNYIDFWFDTIHNCRDEADTYDGKVDPPIIAVCTGLDKLTGKVDSKKDTYLLKLKNAIRDGQKLNHLRDVCFVSNTEQSGQDFDRVRKLIFKYGKQLPSFGQELPLKWIRLEQSLDVLRDGGFNIIAREDVIDLAKKCDILRIVEVERFLIQQHKMGSIIYFEDINSYIILRQQWLADAFRCVVSDKIDNNIKLSDDWELLLTTGIFEISLIAKLFQKEQQFEFRKYENHILQVLNKFDIIGVNYELGKAIYYMPYMIKSEFSPSLSEIVEHFGVVNVQCRRTPWLCYEFDFLPLSYFTSVMLYFIRRYKICFDTKLCKQSIYHGVGVFFLDRTRDHKFIVVFCKNAIAYQVWHWEHIPKDRYRRILIENKKLLDKLEMKYRARNLRYYVKVKCSEGDFNTKIGQMSYNDLPNEPENGKYFCDEHNCKHDLSQLLDTWFYNHPNLPIRIFQRCTNCNNKPSVYWCYGCEKSLCENCNSQHQHSYSHDVQHVHDKYILDGKINIRDSLIHFIIRDLKFVGENLLCISVYDDENLIVVDLVSDEQKTIPLSDSPICIAVIDNSTVAVTTRYPSTTIAIINIIEGHIIKHIDANELCWGIMYNYDHIFVGCEGNIIKVISMSGAIVRTIPLSFSPDYMCGTDDGNIYCTDNNKVYCIDTEGKHLFTCTHPDMEEPYSITTDDTGHIFVACGISKNILSISADGKQCQVIVKQIHWGTWFPCISKIPHSASLLVGRSPSIGVYKMWNTD